MLSFKQKARMYCFVFLPAYILGRIDSYHEFEYFSLLTLLESILVISIGVYISNLSEDYYNRGAYDEAMKYAGTD